MPGAGLLIFRPDGYAFLIRRSPTVKHPGEWDLPGGTVEPGETPIQAAYREGQEETGELPKVSVFGSFYDNGYSTFIASIEQSDADMWNPPLSKEADEYGWFDPASPPQPLRSNVKRVFEKIV